MSVASMAASNDDFIPDVVAIKAPGGQFEKWQKDFPCGAGTFSTNVTLSDPDTDRKWETASQIILRSASEAAIFTLQATHHASPLSVHLVEKRLPGREVDRRDYSSRINLGDATSVKIAWTSTSQITITIDGVPIKPMTLDDPVQSLELVSSGGATKFEQNALQCGPPL